MDSSPNNWLQHNIPTFNHVTPGKQVSSGALKLYDNYGILCTNYGITETKSYMITITFTPITAFTLYK